MSMERCEPADIMDGLAGLAPGSALAELRRRRPEVVRHLQGSDEALFHPRSDGGLTASERLAVAPLVSPHVGDKRLKAHYRARLAHAGGTARGPTLRAAAPGAAQERWQAIIAHAERLTAMPHAARREHIDGLRAVGLSPRAVVALSQVIAYV